MPGFFKLRNALVRARHERSKRRRGDLEREHLVVLDLDHTLIHSVLTADVPAEAGPPFAWLGQPDKSESLGLFKRPGLDTFLSSIKSHERLRVGVWTAGTRKYAKAVLRVIWPSWRDEVLFLASRGRCTWIGRRSCVKELGLLPRNCARHDAERPCSLWV